MSTKRLSEELAKDLQRALIQADVNVKLVLSVTESVQRRALEEKPLGGMTRKDQIVKILYEELDRMLGESRSSSSTEARRPSS